MTTFGSDGHANADLPRALRHGDKQDVHNADSSDQQGNRRNGKEHDGQCLAGTLLYFPDVHLRLDRKVIILLALEPMTRAKHISNLFDSLREVLGPIR